MPFCSGPRSGPRSGPHPHRPAWRALAPCALALALVRTTPAAAQAAAQAPAALPQTAAGSVVVRRADGDSAVLDAAALAALSRHKVRVTEHGRAAVFAGVRLQDALGAAGVRVDSLRGAALGDVLIVEAADGYRVAFALGELAPDLGGRAVLLADRRDGRPLGPAEGPLRLVVPTDGRPARGVRRLHALTVRHTAPAAATDTTRRGAT